jgi:hypothetical protein
VKKKDPPAAKPAKSHSIGRGKRGAFIALLPYASFVGASFFIYWRSLNYPFIQDDWYTLYRIVFRGAGHVLAEGLNPAFQGTFYRPVAQIWFLVLYEFFHLDAGSYYIVNMLIHSANACLVALVMRRLRGTVFTSWAVGMLYVSAALVHVDTIFFAGSAHLGTTFFLASLFYYIGGKTSRSFILFLLALLTKEAAIVLPLVLFLYDVLLRPGAPRPVLEKAKDHFRALRAHWGFVLIFAAFEFVHFLIQVKSSGLPEYGVSMFSLQLVRNLATYCKWSADGIFPEELFPGMRAGIVIAVVLIALWFQVKNWKSGWRMAAFFAGWYLIGLLPVLPLANHAYRYYATYSLPAFFGFLVFPIKPLPRNGANYIPYIVSALLVLNLISASQYVKRIDEHNGEILSLEGSYNPTRRGGVVQFIHEYLSANIPTIADSTLIYIEGMSPEYMGVNAAPCIWYNAPSIRVVPPDRIFQDSIGFYYDNAAGNIALEDPPPGTNERVRIDSVKHVLGLKFKDGIMTSAPVQFVP